MIISPSLASSDEKVHLHHVDGNHCDVPTLMLRIQSGLPVSSAVTRAPTRRELVLHSVRRFGSLPCPSLAYSLHCIRADSLRPKELMCLLSSSCGLLKTSSDELDSPICRSFCGKRRNATVTCLSDTVGWVASPLLGYKKTAFDAGEICSFRRCGTPLLTAFRIGRTALLNSLAFISTLTRSYQCEATARFS